MVCHEGTITWLIACADEAVRGPAPGMSSSETVKGTKAAGGRPSLPVTVTSADVVMVRALGQGLVLINLVPL
jgi:hypothetical protein